ncbi:Vacuolar cation-chloride cotransporter 1 [Tolypocladium paradoxum]|uniref:Vacuolar cation-chloride cotransporter 1 n=1 Tax=Tolypocladium paradoxum TaxID=94208 RepID=A0A2S4L9T2_9HYPO|nr:Vacuolar cation-chloride cotransporter 1 [Tolypocladium paradoxum]
MPPSPDGKRGLPAAMEPKKSGKLGLMSGVYIPVCLNIMSILMFLRFGFILGQIGFMGILGLLVTAYCVDLLTTLSLSAIASNGEVKGGGAYYLISRSLGPEFGGSIGILFFLAQALNTAMNVVGLIDCIRLNIGPDFPRGYWTGYGLQTATLILCTGICLLGSATFSKASNALLAVLTLAVVSIPVSAIFKAPFHDETTGIEFTGASLNTLATNFLPRADNSAYNGLATFRDLFGILFPATSGIFAGASMSGDLKNPSKAIPKGTLWAMLTTFIVYFVVVLSMAASTTHESFLANANVIPLTNLSAPIILAGECAVTFFSALMGIIGSAKLFQALARDKLLPGLSVFGKGTRKNDEPILAILLTCAIAQVALLADLNQIATFISMGYQMTFFVMNLACFLLKIGSAPNFRPGFKFFNWQTAFIGSLLSAAAMFFIDETYAAIAICVLVFIFLLIHYLCPPKRWGDVSQNLIYHQVRKYLLRLKPEHIKFWRPHIILLINNPRRHARLVQFCNSMKKGSLYILGHVIVTDDFNSGVHEARLQQQAWTNYISEFSRIKAFVQLTMSPSITWGIRNLILSAGLGGMRPNIAVLGLYNMDDLRKSNPEIMIPEVPASPAAKMRRPPKAEEKAPRRRRGDTSARLLEGFLPTDVIRTEGMMSPTDYMVMLEDLALKYRLNVAVANGFDKLETPRRDGSNTKKYVDLWPIQMSAEVSSDGKNVLTTNFDTYTLILQLGHILGSVQTWRRAYSLRVMVFVEYASEVEEESARVKALLEKLRIDAKVLVFWLASGHLNTYELMINGRTNDIDTEIIVNDALKDEEWWRELQSFRGQSGHMSSSQEMTQIAQIFDSTVGRPGVYNPHEEGSFDRRRSSMAEVAELPKKPGIGKLSKMGVSVGIHTHHLSDDVLQEPSSDDESYTDAESSDTDGEYDLGPNGPISHGNIEYGDPTKQPLLAATGTQTTGEFSARAGRERKPKAVGPNAQIAPSYGTMSTSQTLMEKRDEPAPHNIPEVKEIGSSPPPQGGKGSRDKIEAFPPLGPCEVPQLDQVASRRSRSMSPTRPSRVRTPRDGAMTPIRPAFSRQSSAVRFSSRPVPETTIIMEAEGSKISFAPAVSDPATPRLERPTHSRQSSWGKFSSRPVPDTKVSVGDEVPRTIQFAEQPVYSSRSASHSRHHSRQGSQYSTFGQGDVSLSIPELVESHKNDSAAGNESQGGSAHSTQGFSLSFNDLPSRAQHLILNELMRQHSKNTAVLMSTLPIPSEGTCLDEMATIQYLSDVEVLCNELPPTLMVLSNNMTVTVSL